VEAELPPGYGEADDDWTLGRGWDRSLDDEDVDEASTIDEKRPDIGPAPHEGGEGGWYSGAAVGGAASAVTNHGFACPVDS
jgi:hypothetical protein